VSLLSDFEDRVGGAIEGLFAGAFRSPVQPAEIAKALARAMDDRRQVGVATVYAPTRFSVQISTEDAEEFGDFTTTLAGELATFLTGHAEERGYKLAGMHVLATVTVSDLHHDIALEGERLVIGRLAECEVTLGDSNVSRRHAAFTREGDGWAIEDLGSTNGTRLNGEKIKHARLRDGDLIEVGATQLRFHEPRR